MRREHYNNQTNEKGNETTQQDPTAEGQLKKNSYSNPSSIISNKF